MTRRPRQHATAADEPQKTQTRKRPNNTGSKPSSPAKDVMAALRAKKAMELRLEGHTWQEVADRAGYTGESRRSAAYNAVNRYLRHELHGSAQHYRRIQQGRLEQLFVEVRTALHIADKEGNEKLNLWAVDRLVALMERQAKLLGLDLKLDGADLPATPLIREYPQGIAEAV